MWYHSVEIDGLDKTYKPISVIEIKTVLGSFPIIGV